MLSVPRSLKRVHFTAGAVTIGDEHTGGSRHTCGLGHSDPAKRGASSCFTQLDGDRDAAAHAHIYAHATAR